MKQKSQNRFFAALLAVAMMLQMLPMLAFADTGEKDVAWIGKKGYKSLEAAISAAGDGATIKLGEGVYLLGDTKTKVTKKSLTFVGAGTDKTKWQIQAPQAPYGADGYCDYSFDGSNSITFQDMTLIGSVYPNGTIKAEDTQGYVRVQNITLKDCVFNGRADYWGYTSTTFDNVTFNAPGTTESEINDTNYSLWTYTGKTYTFRDCTFNSTGKTINVYRHVDPGYDVTVNFENCTVHSNFSESAKESKTALSIGDHTFGSSKYILNIITPHVTAARDKFTCSQVFGFGDNDKKNTGRTDVYLNGALVWTGGKKLTHSYTDGEKDDAYTITDHSDWTPSGADRIDKCEVTKTCDYCGWTKKELEYASVYRLQYNLNGGDGDATADYNEHFYRENESVTLAAKPTREGYQFAGWLSLSGKLYKAESELKQLTGDEVFTAQWKKDEPVVNHTLTVTGGTFAVKNGGIDVTDTLDTSTDEASGKQTCLVPDGAEVTVTLDQTKVPDGMVFDLWSTGKFDLPQDQDYKAESITFTMNDDVDVAAQYRSADIEDGSDVVGPIIVGTAVVAGGALVGYTLGTDLVGKMWGLPYFPSNRSALAMMLWEDAGKPMPESEILYPDVGQEEQDMDLQHAARWAMEHDLLPDLNDQDAELPPEQVKFYPDNMVTKISVLRAWKKAQDLKQNAQ
ncbi:InlB B-repeat-containing protein [Faecalibacterium prausnitzii]|uniref:InlB B-repeat-containing protein n=1 Tax=Faecalibacterium prausnitzii TaxID=853 RepID=UPI0012DC1F64|nr:InlB B-repeat-containing protein [Faecalibacterium prausnitzii]